ncbi:tryptophan--tRNA ligase [Actinomadura sp. DC4]|uniref:tryptophan--tRNA ligase n=1 Tax=Actinomadura sp. DC4 TaxID=3055069 RepID=UPI0025B16F50|nr:tryptophan--tRNA ligase [Actinomadura sp. DC4]MDN3353949.1 tryptophan--tRNA ligase [Actinomadura sp. DC4]
MKRVLSLFTPSGRPTLGNLLGAFLPSVRLLPAADCVFGVSDLHALTSEHDPALLRERSLELAGLAVAAGLDPDRCLLFLQSNVPAHAELSYLLESTAHYGEMQRMIQFREKSARQSAVRLSLLTYPALMAADILLYQATDVPVGADQAQHVELTRDLATRFNNRYGPVFTLPHAVHPPAAARVMDLADPVAKMSKSVDSPGTIFLLDPVDVVRRKIMRAVTDSGTSVEFDPEAKPGVSNLLSILSACTGTPVADLSPGSYGALKRDTADAVIALLEPLQRRHAELSADPATLEAILRDGAERARERAAGTVTAAKEAMGLLAA